ncbi:MAG: hypothetical protein PUG60_10515 [Lachnospiraceae bacterium]|nr:hypothetical protein [Lachnospiraceae bacterium]
MVINGVEFDFDISDLKDHENYVNALKAYDAKIPEMKQTEGTDTLRFGISMIRDFFYDATGVDVCADVTSLTKAVGLYKAFIEKVAEQSQELNKMFDEFKTDKKEKAVPVYPVGYMGGARPPRK